MTTVHLEAGLTADDYRLEHGRFPVEIGGLRFVNDDANGADWLVENYDSKAVISRHACRANGASWS